MMRLLAFSVVFLVGAACHVETKKVKAGDITAEEHVVTNSVTTAPTERVTETWRFSVTPGTQPPGLETARSTPSAGSSPAGFLPFVGKGYALDEYERVTEKLAPVATTTTKTDTNSEAKTVESSDKDTDIGFSLKFYLLAGGLLAAIVALGLFLSHSKLIRRLLGVPL